MTWIVSASSEELAELDKDLWAKLTDEERAHNDRVTEMHRLSQPHGIIIATDSVTGILSTFHFAEHFNLGPGWMMTDMNDKKRRIVSSFQLTDMKLP